MCVCHKIDQTLAVPILDATRHTAIHEQCVRHVRNTYIAEAFRKTLPADFAETQLYQSRARLRPADHKCSGATGRRDVSFPCGISTVPMDRAEATRQRLFN